MSKKSLPGFKGSFAKTSGLVRAGRSGGQAIGLLIRELVGWGLLLLGLNVFRISFAELNDRRVVEAGIAAMIGLFIFRGGMQLLKVAVAARALMPQRPHESVVD